MPLLICTMAPIGMYCVYSADAAEDFDRAIAILKSGKDIQKSVALLTQLYEQRRSDKYHAYLLCSKAALLVEEKARQSPQTLPEQTVQVKALAAELLAFKKSVAENLKNGREKSEYLNLVSWSMLLLLKAAAGNFECAELQKALREEIVSTAKESVESYPQYAQLKESGDLMLSSVENYDVDARTLQAMVSLSAKRKQIVVDAIELMDKAVPKQADAASVWLYLATLKQENYMMSDKTVDITRFKNAADADNQNAYFALNYAFLLHFNLTKPGENLTKISEDERKSLLEYFFKGLSLKTVKPVYYSKSCPRFLKWCFPDEIISRPMNVMLSGGIYLDLCNDYINKGDFRAAIQTSDSMFDIGMQMPGLPDSAKEARDIIEGSASTSRAIFYLIGIISKKIIDTGANIPLSDKMMLCTDLKRLPPQDVKTR